ncbi:hypothetical protein PR202_ga25071 [Eleusine coracana subsp. coracana]|uniref:DUF4220 domain-containing protein n=1 Tax=Eleusine coracana subsp. coracana TaxID=191504 RepID=A0AAV5DAE5_ELECO|nr:hypothetical protein QOZ80_9AG0671360 [Eleusine coracana subsp. coracana]GJN07252.1 hypothetical protein PR202_ga25071 [Eleusine coracana subsp. coracana]
MVVPLVQTIVGTVRGLFHHDGSTGAASVQLWAVVATVLLLLKFAVGCIGPRFSSRRLMAPGVRMLEILNYYAVNYTLGLMKPSSSQSQGTTANISFFFQVWAVLITTMQDSIRIGRPYRPKEMSLIDLLSSLWSANQLRAPAPMYLKVPLWVMWSIHAARIIWYYFSFNRAGDAGLGNIKLVSDYMMTSQHTNDINDDDEHPPCPRTMRGYKYIVFGEDEQKMEVLPPGFTLEMDLHGPNANQLVTLETIWKQADDPKDSLLSSTADPDNRFKDVCLSFALYKLQRRRFYNFPIAEVTHQATSRLVSETILEVEEGTNNNTNNDGSGYKRAFRITEVELSLLQDLFYSKHASVFARGFPYVRLALSQLMIFAASYLIYAISRIPSANKAVVMTRDGHVARITHGVFVTHCIIAVVVCRELWEVGVYILSQWTKVWIISRHMKLTRRLRPAVSASTSSPDTESQGMMKWCRGMSCRWQLVMLDKVARIMFFAVRRGRWDPQICQHNILMSALIKNKRWMPLAPPREFIARKVELQREVTGALFQSLKDLIHKIPSPPPSPAQGSSSKPRPSSEAWTKQMNKLLGSYFENAFISDDAPGSSSSNDPTVSGCWTTIAGELKGESHKILVWHIATSLCHIKLLEQGGGDDLYTLPRPFRGGGGLAAHYVTAVSLSNYCMHLVTEALVPDNGLVVDKVFHSVREEEVCEALRGCTTMMEIPSKLAAWEDKKTILGMGTQL